MKPFKKLTRIIFLYAIAIIILSEVILRMVSFIYIKYYPHEYGIIPKDNFRILCLGDSFTYGWGAEFTANYPAQLEKILNQKSKDIKFKVINAGIPGNNSSLLLNNLNSSISLYDPNLLIVMIGMNDWWNYEGINLNTKLNMDSIIMKLDSVLMNIKIYRLIKIARLNQLYSRYDPEINYQPINMHKEAFVFMQNYQYDRAIEYCENMLVKNPFDAGPYQILSVIYQKQSNYPAAIGILERAIELLSKNHLLYYELGKIFMHLNEWDKLFALTKNAIDIGLDDPVLYYFLLESHGRGDEPNRAKIEAFLKSNKNYKKLIKHPLTLRNQIIAEIMFDNFKKIIEICRDKNIKLIFSGYPEMLHPVMQKIINEYGADFINHVPVFQKIFKTAKREQYISYDNSHCNENGYRIMAENIADKILLLFKIK